eukprot:c27680_g1_i1.p1 GENE.c27680_g1_i1~~c27680_g1_i1.p1  ORF type:complete len:359 (+),score=60.78 c27680_g1_i1:45-1079(+)
MWWSFFGTILGWGLMDFCLYMAAYLQRVPMEKSHAIFFIAMGAFPAACFCGSLFHFCKGRKTLICWYTTLMPFISGFMNGLGYLSYYALSAILEASTLSPMVSLYIIFPITFGLCCRGEERSVTKFFGILLASFSMLMIGSGSEENYEVAADPWARPNSFRSETLQWLTCMYISFGISSASGTLAGAYGKEGQAAMIISSSLGFVCLSLLMALASWSTFTIPPLADWERYHSLLIVSGALFIFGYAAYFVLSGASGQISVVVPLTALYTMVPTFLGFVVLGEHMSALKAGGILCAGCAVYLLTLKKKPKLVVAEDLETDAPLLGHDEHDDTVELGIRASKVIVD